MRVMVSALAHDPEIGIDLLRLSLVAQRRAGVYSLRDEFDCTSAAGRTNPPIKFRFEWFSTRRVEANRPFWSSPQFPAA
ncbi:hypothetical protein BQ8482_110059 [Mesorhizobium delmotii]|uniref:Uncharacterized protein n=1 Tax=Mesorhizobium delmotii TaxID=1631247 RepID=A0A2P9AAH4_9HYPH|nr:hypothetical protein BQ8482_110059 [Mesorhizobium delmotii]